MKIAINTRLLLDGKMDGIGWFTWETARRISAQHPQHEFHFLFDRPFNPKFIESPNVIPHIIYPPARHPWLFRIWYDWMIPWKLKSIAPDLFVSPDSVCSLRLTMPQLIVMHDLNFVHYPQDLVPKWSRYLNHFSPKFAQHATRIATVSEFSKRDIATQYHISPDKIDVVYNGVNEGFSPLADCDQEQLRKQWTQNNPYFVFIGSAYPRKNLQRLLPAFDRYKSITGDTTKLVIVGRRFADYPEIDRALKEMQHAQDVVFTGMLNDVQLHGIVASALALVYVSYFEGFGIPILEAFQCDVPVITSNITSMPEVAGDAALLVDPFSSEEMANAMIQIAQQPALRSQLIEKGRERLQQFSWNKSAELLWQSMLKTIATQPKA